MLVKLFEVSCGAGIGGGGGGGDDLASEAVDDDCLDSILDFRAFKYTMKH